MFNSAVDKIKESWGIMRLMRMALALMLIYDGWMGETWWILGLGAVFGYQALMNIGCGQCMSKEGCNRSAPYVDPSDPPEIEIEYKEVSK